MKEEAKAKIKGIKKLRFLKEHSKKEYINDMKSEEARKVLRIKLNMTCIKGNIGVKESCRLCEDMIEETTEHMINWRAIHNTISKEDIESTKSETLM